jgi:hypothetical protein
MFVKRYPFYRKLYAIIEDFEARIKEAKSDFVLFNLNNLYEIRNDILYEHDRAVEILKYYEKIQQTVNSMNRSKGYRKSGGGGGGSSSNRVTRYKNRKIVKGKRSVPITLYKGISEIIRQFDVKTRGYNEKKKRSSSKLRKDIKPSNDSKTVKFKAKKLKSLVAMLKVEVTRLDNHAKFFIDMYPSIAANGFFNSVEYIKKK